MEAVIDWAKTEEAKAQIEKAKDYCFTERFACSRIWPNLFVGGASCSYGIVYLGPETDERRIKSPENKPDESIIIAYEKELLGFEISEVQQKIEEFGDYFVPYRMHPGNGPFDYVYTTNGRAYKKTHESLDLDAQPTTSPKTYLKPEYFQDDMGQCERVLDGELYRNLGEGLKDQANFEKILGLIDKAADILIEGKEKIIVHCSSGVERSVTTIIAILFRILQRGGIKYSEDILHLITEFVQVRRPSASKFEDSIPAEIKEQNSISPIKGSRTSIHQMRENLMNYLAAHPKRQEMTAEGGGGGSKAD